jgi:hypothetical protein
MNHPPAMRIPVHYCWMLPRRWTAVIAMGLASVATADAPVAVPIPPFSAMAPGAPAPPWRIAGLPRQTLPMTRFDIAPGAGASALRISAEASYGNLVLDTARGAVTPGLMLRWSWSLERGLATSDLSRKDGDDVPLKVCALFDMPLDGLPLAERLRVRAARALSGEHLPAATLCYVWDRLLPVGSRIPNAVSARVQYLVVSSGPGRPGQWTRLERPLAEDFRQAFGHEVQGVPPLLAIAVGADADNTRGNSQGWVGDITLSP